MTLENKLKNFKKNIIKNIPTTNNDTPKMDGTGDSGNSTDYARTDHKHPSDTSKVNVTDIKDNLTSTDTNKPLSAKQGKELKTLVDGKANSSHTHTSAQVTESSALNNIGTNANSTQHTINDAINTALGNKIEASDVAGNIDLTGYVKTTDIKDNLTSTDTNKPLSAKQGKELKTLVDGKSNVTFTQTKTSGVEIGKINIDGTSTTLYQQDNNTTYSTATTSANGLMSSTDKTKLDGMDTGANKTTIDTALSSSSTNPVQNKVINTALSGKANSSHNQATTTITNDQKYNNIKSGESTTLTLTNQKLINDAINTKIGDITSIKFIEIVTSKPTASASTMNKLYVVSENSKVNVYYTRESSGSYSWQKMDTDILDELSIAWNDITGKPSTFTPSSHTHGSLANGGTLNSDITSVNKVAVTDSSNNLKTISKLPDTSISWNGTSLKGEVSPLDMTMYEEFSANRLAYLNGNNITVEYSTNSGSTWTATGTATEKLKLVTTGSDFKAGNNSTIDYAKNQIRVTIKVGEQSTNSLIYMVTRKLMLYLCTCGASGCKCKVSTSMYKTPTTFNDVGTYDVDGYSGWNSIPLYKTIGGYANQVGSSSDRIQNIRLTFTQTGGTGNLGINKIRLFGETQWAVQSNLARNGHIYAYDENQNVTFPNGVYTNGKFVKNGGTNTQLLLANGDTKATTDFATSGHTHTKSQITDFPTSMTPTSHTHGNITNDGKVGTTATLPLITGTGGVVQAGSFGTSAGTFCQGNDSRLSNARTPIFNHIGATSSATKDLNNYTTGGFYYADNDNTESPYISNQPRTSGQKAFWMLVETWGASNNSYVKQTLTYYDTAQTYVRTKRNTSGWTSWIEMTKDTNTTYTGSDGITLSGTTFKHSNTGLTPVTTSALKKIKYDAQGHITGTDNVSASDLPSHTHNYLTSHQDISGKADKTNGASQITDTNANNYTNIGSLSSGATQQAINSAINTKIASLTNIDLVKLVTSLPTASASTMNQLYVVAKSGGATNDGYNIYVTVKNGSSYAWEKVDDFDLQTLSIGWSSVTGKPTIDTTVANNANNLVTSQAVYNGLNNKLDKTNTSQKGKALVTNSSTGTVEYWSIDSSAGNNASNLISSKAVYNGLSGKAPTSHASTGTGYGVGTASNYGHNKIIDDATKSSVTNGESLSAHMGYVLNNQDVEFLTTNHSGTGNVQAWTATCTKLRKLEDGTKIILKLTSAGHANGVTLNLTLADGTSTGAKNIKWNATSNLTTHYGAGQVIHLVYDNTDSVWRMIQPPTWGANNNNSLLYAGVYIKANSGTDLTTQTFVGAKNDGTYYKLASGVVLDVRYPIVWTNGAITKNTYSNNVWHIHNGANTTNNGFTSLTTYGMVYVEGSAYSKGQFTISSTVLTQTLSTGKYYIILGEANSASQIRFRSDMTVYYYNGTNLIPVSSWDGITDKPSTFTPSSHTHGSLANGGTLNSDITSVNKVAVTDSSNNLKTIGSLPASKVSGLSNVATSGSYNDLSNKPTIPSAVSFTQTKTSGVEIGKITIGSTTTSLYQQDNNTTYSAGTGLSLSSGAFSVNFGGSTATDSNKAVACNDSRLSNARTPTSHTHGNLQNNGQVGSTAVNSGFVTTTSAGLITAQSKIGNIGIDGKISGQATKNVCTDANGLITTEAKNNHTHTTDNVAITQAYTIGNVTLGDGVDQSAFNEAITQEIALWHDLTANIISTYTKTSVSLASSNPCKFYVNKAIRLCELQVTFASYSYSADTEVTCGKFAGIGLNYAPKHTVRGQGHYGDARCALTTDGTLYIHTVKARSNSSMGFSLMWHY